MKIMLNGKHGFGKYTIVSPNDFGIFNEQKWFLATSGYVCRNFSGKTIYLHREIMKPKTGFVVDHINMNKLDNRRENLRNVTRSINSANRHEKNNASGYRGVTYYKRDGNWKAQIKVMYKNIHLGYFETPKEAAEIYKKAYKKYFERFL